MKYRFMVLGVLLTTIVIFILSIINIHFNEQEKINIKEVTNYSQKISTLKKAITDIEDKKCKKELEKMAKRINETNFEKDPTIKEYYDAYYKNEESFTDIYNKVIETCKIEENDAMMQDIIIQSIYPEEIKNRYTLKYELILKDNLSRENLYESLNEKGTFITKTMELNILRTLIEEVKNEKDL